MHVHNRTEPALTGYQGGDRRAVARGVALSGRLLVRWTAAGAAGIFVLATTVVMLTPGSTIDLWPITLAFWCTLVLGSGVALIVAWRIGGWARPGQLGTALVALALFLAATAGEGRDEDADLVAAAAHGDLESVRRLV